MRPAWLAVAFASTAACSHPRPKAAWSGRTTAVVGSSLRVNVSWSDTCTDWGESYRSIFAKNTDDHFDTDHSCGEQSFEAQLECSIPCKAESFVGVGFSSLEVIPLAPGRLTVTAKLHLTGGDERKTKKLPSITVLEPERLGLLCMTGSNSDPCGPDGVDARTARIIPVAWVGNERYPSTLMRVNGATTKDYVVPLAELFKDAQDGTGVKPGTYPITLELLGLKASWDVVARP